MRCKEGFQPLGGRHRQSAGMGPDRETLAGLSPSRLAVVSVIGRAQQPRLVWLERARRGEETRRPIYRREARKSVLVCGETHQLRQAGCLPQ